MSAEYFLDTNLLVYSFDHSEPAKRDKSQELIENALKTRQGVISWQVVQEYFNVALHKWDTPMQPADAQDYLHMTPLPICRIYPSVETWSAALRIVGESQYRFYDAMIVASAIQSGSVILYSEDLQNGRKFGNLEISNPFL
jgi:predicted nucleic acid-binding protein